MKFDENPYYSPELCGLEIFESIDTADSYEFNIFCIWKKLDDGSLWWDTDSGCSCPSPFSNSDNGHDLKKITDDTFYNFEEALKNHSGIRNDDYLNTVKKVKDYMRSKSSEKPKEMSFVISKTTGDVSINVSPTGKLVKPEPRVVTRSYYDYFKCRDYIKEKYSFSDSAMKKFWIRLCDIYGINNDSDFWMSLEEYSRPADYMQAEIFDAFKEEFCTDSDSIHFHVSW